ncbi:MAG: histidine--tRNA ligase [Ruminococcaceae bacterium]|nr:histidine--tRNA ligase [Oscillospiraceae bacterium]
MFIKETTKGMRDILPAESEIREYLLTKLKKTYASFGFSQIETPAVEHIENLTSKQGGENEKLIFKILKRGEKLSESASGSNVDDLVDSGLRYDLTVPLSRYYSNNAANLSLPFKAMQIGPVWRADRPQKGRFRQFTQCDIDILGDASNAAEIELITATSTFLESVGVGGCTVMINDRRILAAMARASGFSEDQFGLVFIILDKYDKIGEAGIEKELLEAGYAPECVAKYMEIFRGSLSATDRFAYLEDVLGDAIEEGVVANIKEIVEAVAVISEGRFNLEFDVTLVRGMGYYTGTIFEIKSEDFKGSSIAGGGRYDNMIGNFTGQKTCACGFSIGFERIVGALLEKGFKPSDRAEKTAVLYDKRLGATELAMMQKKAMEYRNAGRIILVQKMNKNVGFQKQKLEADGYTKFVDVRYPDEISKLDNI